MQSEEPERMIAFLDDDAVKALSDDELIAYQKRIYEYMLQHLDDFPGVTMEMLDEIKMRNDAFEIEVEKCKVADREAAIAKARMERSADAYLLALDKVDKSRGN